MFKESKNSMESNEFAKYLKCNTSRTSRPSATLDMHKVEQYFTDWAGKWDLMEVDKVVHEDHDPSLLPSFNPIISIDSLNYLKANHQVKI